MSQTTRQKRRLKGECERCSKTSIHVKAMPGKRYCEKCSKVCHDEYLRLKESNKCTTCGYDLEKERYGKSTCLFCRGKNRISQSRRKPDSIKRNRAKSHERYYWNKLKSTYFGA